MGHSPHRDQLQQTMRPFASKSSRPTSSTQGSSQDDTQGPEDPSPFSYPQFPANTASSTGQDSGVKSRDLLDIQMPLPAHARMHSQYPQPHFDPSRSSRYSQFMQFQQHTQMLQAQAHQSPYRYDQQQQWLPSPYGTADPSGFQHPENASRDSAREASRTSSPISSKPVKTPKNSKKRPASDSVSATDPAVENPAVGRFDSSLGLLTKKFINVLRESRDGVLDLNQAANQLNVQKRRIYDITNVLEGINLIEKTTKNHIRWKGDGTFLQNRNVEHHMAKVRAENEALQKQLEHFKQMRHDLDAAHEDLMSKESARRLLYVSKEDLENLPDLQSKKLLAVRVPAGARLTVPQSQEEWQSRFVLHIQSEAGAIECVQLSEFAEQRPFDSGLLTEAQTISHLSKDSGAELASPFPCWDQGRASQSDPFGVDDFENNSPLNELLGPSSSTRVQKGPATSTLNIELPERIPSDPYQFAPDMYGDRNQPVKGKQPDRSGGSHTSRMPEPQSETVDRKAAQEWVSNSSVSNTSLLPDNENSGPKLTRATTENLPAVMYGAQYLSIPPAHIPVTASYPPWLSDAETVLPTRDSYSRSATLEEQLADDWAPTKDSGRSQQP